jgi:hypothetical protein
MFKLIFIKQVIMRFTIFKYLKLVMAFYKQIFTVI